MIINLLLLDNPCQFFFLGSFLRDCCSSTYGIEANSIGIDKIIKRKEHDDKRKTCSSVLFEKRQSLRKFLFEKRKVFHITQLQSNLDRFQIQVIKVSEGVTEVLNQVNQLNSLVYVASGTGQLIRKERRLPVVEGKSYLIHEESLIISTSSKLLTVYSLSWEKEMDELASILSVPLADQLPAHIVPLWEEAVGSQRGKSISERCRFQGTVWHLLSLLTDHTKVDKIDEAVDIIRNRLSNPYSIAILADKANMNPTSFSRAFRKRVGMSPKEFLNEERMKAAKVLMLQNKGMTTKDVALQLGLQDEFYFSRLFKQKVGLPPSVYKKKSKDRIAIVSQLFLQDHLLSLGIQPVVAPSYPSLFPSSYGLPKYLGRELEGTLLLNAEKMFKPEQILQSQPDLILITPLHNGEIQSFLLAQQQKVQNISFKTSWNEYLRELASMFGKESRIDCVEKEIHCLESRVKDELCSMTRKGSWGVIWVRATEIRLYGCSNHAFLDLFYQKLGFEPHPDLMEDGYKVVTIEELAALGCDKLLILWSHERDVWRVAQTKEWKGIRAVENKEVYYPKSHEWDPWGPLGRKNMLLDFTATLQNSKLIR